LRESLPKNIFISIDTYKAKVAQKAIEVGADIVNDISGLTFDKDMINVLKSTHAPVVINHIKGTPKDMQKNPYYENVLDEVSKFFEEKIETLLKVNYPYTNIILDVGIGFGKRLEDNLTLIKNISHFKKFGLPILVGTSRKSFIGKILNLDDPKERLEGTLASNLYLYQQGANIFRVHDVKEHRRALELLDVLSRC
ncbi:MAG TPA: dihydropteroate synthase, partial [Desulfurobacteriaceae bacterium]|nr:dihydropteroate synthase [Desulfurobacteriaceae bacterium]